jgi:uncharacterized protein involved in outer membrane biogenesis
MKRTALVAAALAIVLAGCLAGYAALDPEALLRKELAKSVRKVTGRNLTIDGGASVALTPAFAVTFHKISFGAPPDAPGEALLNAESVKVEAELLPLLIRRVKIRRVILDRPSLNLLMDAQGRSNWDGIGPVRLQNGPAAEADSHASARREALSKAVPPVDSGASAKPAGDGGPDAQRAQAGRGDPAAGRPKGAALEETALYIKDGVISYRDLARKTDFRLTGVDLSLRPDPASNSLEARGAASASEERLTYKMRVGALNEPPSTGVPFVIEVASRLGAMTLDGQGSLTNRKGRLSATCSGRATVSAEEIGRFSGDVEIEASAENGDFLNAIVRPSVLTYRNAAVQGGRVNIRAKGGAVNAHFEGVNVYGGAARGDLKVDARQGPPVVSGSVTMDGVAAHPLLTNLSRFDWLSGAGGVSLTFAGAGATSAQFMKTLSGEARLSLSDGALEGLNLPKMLRAAQNGVYRWSRAPDERTPFDRFSANFAIANGVARTTDISLSGPNVSMSGDGSVDLARETLDLRLKPRITAAPDTQAKAPPAAGAQADFIEIPLIARGPWAKPRIEPDLNKVLADPAAAAASAKTLAKPIEKLTGGAIKSEDVGKAIEALFGKKKKRQQ